MAKALKGQHFSFRVTAAQKRAIEKAARRVALDPGSFIRMVVLRETEYDPERDEPKNA